MTHTEDTNKTDASAIESYCRDRLNDPTGQYVKPSFPPVDFGNLRIIHGTMEIANQMHTMSQGLKELGATAHTLNYYPTYLQYKADIQLNVRAYKHVAIKDLACRIISTNDIFHFHFGTSLTLNNSDLPLLRELDKKVLMHHWGSDVRLYSQAVKNNPYVKVKVWREDTIRGMMARLSKQIDTCAVCDQELYEYVRNYYSRVVFIPLVIDIREFDIPAEALPNKRLTIVHAPTSPEIKGTAHVLKAVEELKTEFDFDFILVQGMSYPEAKKVYQSADIVIDQLLVGSYGLFSIENMALGKPVVCWISDFMMDNYPPELPLIRANPDTIKQVLTGLLRNRDSLQEIGQRSRQFVEIHHDISKHSRELLDLYKSL